MDILLPFLGFVALIVLFVRVMSEKECDEQWEEHEVRLNQTKAMFNTLSAAYEESRTTDKINNNAMTNNVNEPNTLGLMVDVLEKLGCQPTINEDETLSVKYQGETFIMDFGGLYARIWDPMWSSIKADNPNLPKVRDAVNAANFNFGPTVVLTDPDEEGVIGFHSRRDIMLHPACPDNVPFVRAVLDSFFDAKEQVQNNYQQLNFSQMDVQKNRRPIGFTTTPNE